MKGFSLIEVLIVVSLLGILSSSVVLAVNPVKRIQQARDARRKMDIGAMANALIAYSTINSQYPDETGCDSSIGMHNGNCPPHPASNTWNTNSDLFFELVSQGFLKILPTDPINDTTYYYRYEPRRRNEDPCKATNQVCRYWIGARLEDPIDPLKPIFRCSDIEDLADGDGCKEVNNFYN